MEASGRRICESYASIATLSKKYAVPLQTRLTSTAGCTPELGYEEGVIQVGSWRIFASFNRSLDFHRDCERPTIIESVTRKHVLLDAEELVIVSTPTYAAVPKPVNE